MANMLITREMHIYFIKDIQTMDGYRQEIEEIKKILQENSKGMTVTDISRKIKINRNSVAKYLDILLISGHAEMVTFGPAKVFFPSRRIPLSAMLNFTLDYIILIDKELNIMQINDNLLKFLNQEKKDIIGQNIASISSPIFQIPELISNIQNAVKGKESTLESTIVDDDVEKYLQIKNIPTTFDDGEPGITLIIEDITKRKTSEKKMKQAIKEWEITFNSVSDMISILDKDFTITKVNSSFAKLFNLQPEDCIGKKCYDLLHGSSKPRSSCPCKQIESSSEPKTIRFFEEKVGKNLEITASPIYNEKDEFTGSVHIIKELNNLEN